MYGNGVTIGTIAAIIVIVQAIIRKDLQQVSYVFYVAVVGPTTPTTVVLPFATTTTLQPPPTTFWASARCLFNNSKFTIRLFLLSYAGQRCMLLHKSEGGTPNDKQKNEIPRSSRFFLKYLSAKIYIR